MMSNPAQEEADRLFGARNHRQAVSHPEDQDTSDRDDNSSNDDSVANQPHRNIIRSGGRQQLRHGSESDEDNDDDDMTATTTTTTSAKNAYTLPSAVHYANTGPKGVIADAQNYHRSKRRAFRQTLESLSHNLSLNSRPKRTGGEKPAAAKKPSDGSGSEEDDEEDDEFMQQWRQQRLAELQEQASGGTSQQRKASSPSVRTYGRLDAVDANGYLDAIEKCPAEAVVVVLLYDHTSAHSGAVEAELERLAYKYGHVHFVKLPHDVAEMETVDIPAVLAYRGGDVFATVSGAVADGVENVLKEQGVLARR